MRTEQDIWRDEAALKNYKSNIEHLFTKYNKQSLVEDVDIMNNWISFEEEINSLVDIKIIKDGLNKKFEDSFRKTLINLGKELHKKVFPNLDI